MKSSDRCQANYQGDRCTKAALHDSDLRLGKADKLHMGQFSAWKDGEPAMPLTMPMGRIDRRTKVLDRLLTRAKATENKALLKHVLGQYERMGVRL